ncbi:unnamed protein product [Sphenostylis stenocarpa]|uniref:Uncharacterized protein n=1 Tax=Sphenostylis stenocarpa TaxID=92480 RepID=A0AA86S3L4_9FABA|nr:unnamed protein product [Sphenostylis stenocarpa]
MNTILCLRLRLSPTPLFYYYTKSPFLQPSLFFSTTTSDPHAFTISYLTNTCGFSREVALKLTKRIRFNSADKPDSVISFFRTHGFSTSQIHHIFCRGPDLMLCNPTQRLLPKFHFLASKGASPSVIVNMVTKSPRFLRYSLNNHISPTFQMLRTFLPSDHKALSVFVACPNFIGDCRVASNVDMLLDAGVKHSSIRLLLRCRPSVLCSDLRTAMEEVKLLGFNPLKLTFILALLAKRAVSKSLWDAKVDVLKKWGWSEDEILVAFRNQPNMMLRSTKKLNAVMEFWVGRLGWDHSALVASPTLFSYSLENRVVPRALVVQYLLSKGLVKKDASLVTPFGMSDEWFLEKYVRRFKEETPRLLELYQESKKFSRCRKPLQLILISIPFSPSSRAQEAIQIKFLSYYGDNSILSQFRTDDISEMLALLRQSGTDSAMNLKKGYSSSRAAGASSLDIVYIVTTSPHFLRRSLENHIIPAYELVGGFLQSLFTDKQIIDFLIQKHYLFDDGHLVPNVKLLLDNGVTRSNIVKFSRDGLLYSALALATLNKSKWTEKINTCKSWGWSQEQVLLAFRRQPYCMLSSPAKINAVMSYLVEQGFRCAASYLKYVKRFKEDSSHLLKLYTEKMSLGNDRDSTYDFCQIASLASARNL